MGGEAQREGELRSSAGGPRREKKVSEGRDSGNGGERNKKKKKKPKNVGRTKRRRGARRKKERSYLPPCLKKRKIRRIVLLGEVEGMGEWEKRTQGGELRSSGEQRTNKARGKATLFLAEKAQKKKKKDGGARTGLGRKR